MVATEDPIANLRGGREQRRNRSFLEWGWGLEIGLAWALSLRRPGSPIAYSYHITWPPIACWGSSDDCRHFTNVGAEAWRGRGACPGPHSQQW